MDLVSEFNEKGIVYPVDILTDDQAETYSAALSEYLEHIHWQLTPATRHKPHLIFPWVRKLAENENILSAIKPVLGEDILLWYSVIFVKPPLSDMFVPWHQDATYWALKNRNEGLTVWIALNEVNKTNGSMSCIPGSHHEILDQNHYISKSRQNLLARGQMLDGVDGTGEEWVTLRRGQASIHHNMIVHRSGPNHSDQPRLGVAFRYIKTDNKPTTLKWMKRSATLVSGKDEYHNFVKDPDPSVDSPKKCRRAHRISVLKATLHTLAGDTNRNIVKKIADSVPTIISNIPKICKH